LDIRETAHVKIAEDYQPHYPEVEHKLTNDDLILVREVLSLQQDNKYELINRVAEKIEEELGVQMRERSHPFLRNILKDYNYYNNREVDVEKELRKGLDD